MADDSIRTLARHLDVPERTLRRAVAQGLVHGRRVSERRFKTTLREEAYLREHWGMLRDLRGALRTEPNVRLAVLFGSLAVGQETEGSDVDVLVRLRDGSAGAMAALAQRLSDRVARDVQLVRVAEAERSAVLMADALSHGRVLVDRDQLWPGLKAAERGWRRRAGEEDVALEDAMPDLDARTPRTAAGAA